MEILVGVLVIFAVAYASAVWVIFIFELAALSLPVVVFYHYIQYGHF